MSGTGPGRCRQGQHRLGRLSARMMWIRIQHPRLGVVDREVARGSVHHVRVDLVACLDDDLIALVQLQQPPERLAVGDPVTGESEVPPPRPASPSWCSDRRRDPGSPDPFPRGSAPRSPTRKRGSAAGRYALTGDHRRSRRHPCRSRHPIRRTSRGQQAASTLLPKLRGLLVERLLRCHVRAEVLPCHPAQAAEASHEQQHPDDRQRRDPTPRTARGRRLVRIGEVIHQGLDHPAIVPAVRRSPA